MSAGERFDLAVVGAGIAGLAHARAAAQDGARVVVFDRSRVAEGASVRNFGMIWPVGQPSGEWHQTALRSRELWLEASRGAGFWAMECGSVHLAHNRDEMDVLEEFSAGAAASRYDCKILNRAETIALAPAARPDGLLGSLWSSTELAVNPREAIGALPAWLAASFGVEFHFGTHIRHVESGLVEASDGRRWNADRVVVCGGADLKTLFPEVLSAAGLRPCKLQMLRTRPQPSGWRIGPHIASGLTLRHYANFNSCKSLQAVRERVTREMPELDKYGIHVMVSQNQHGEAILGDSHEYDAEITIFDKQEINELMLRELRKIVNLPVWEIGEQWHGIYAKRPEGGWFEADPLPGVKAVTGFGGAGMTLSFGAADGIWKRWNATRPKTESQR